jgi:hypothetical protein
VADDLSEIRRQLLDEIYRVFAGVHRDGGVSWSQADALDDWGATIDSTMWARKQDTESGWEDLVSDQEWITDKMYGGFCFLDPIGFRYYLPAAMVRGINEGTDFLHFHLRPTRPVNPEEGVDSIDEQTSLLTVEQKRCVAHYLLYFRRVVVEFEKRVQPLPHPGLSEPGDIDLMIEEYWGQYL